MSYRAPRSYWLSVGAQPTDRVARLLGMSSALIALSARLADATTPCQGKRASCRRRRGELLRLQSSPRLRSERDDVLYAAAVR